MARWQKMPELPEIETIRKKLAQRISGLKMSSVVLNRPNLRIPIPQNIENFTVNVPITKVRRRAKYLWIGFAHGWTLIIHLGMSGRLYFTSPDRTFDRHDHVLFNFTDGQQMRLNDPRRFGLVTVCKTRELCRHELFCHLGVEPLSRGFHGKYFHDICRKSLCVIKAVLMDAKKVVGVGNIYANEALFLTGIRPQRRAKYLTRSEVKALCGHVKAVLRQSIRWGGTTFKDFVDIDEKPGLHQLKLNVYARAGQPCLMCKTAVKRIIQGNRSSFFCPKCQKR